MFGIFLSGLAGHSIKFLEIGLGCGQPSPNGVGGSIPIWKSLLPKAEFWIAGFDLTGSPCRGTGKAEGETSGANILTGDREKKQNIARLVQKSGGNFDVIVDHGSNLTINAFLDLWKRLNPAGLYFIKDLQVRSTDKYRKRADLVVGEVVEGWIDALLIRGPKAKFQVPSGVKFIFCQAEACVVAKTGNKRLTQNCGPGDRNIANFKEIASSLRPVTDKVTTHSYETMYGIFLSGLAQRKTKLLEIGLGCGVPYGVGASIPVWNKVLPLAEIWVAEFDAACAKQWKDARSSGHAKVLVGDQEKVGDIERWVQESGGKFDIIVDDGGHKNSNILNTILGLWKSLNPGGLYFIEDLHVGRRPSYFGSTQHIMSDVIQGWVHALLMPNPDIPIPLPFGVKFIFCQAEACVIGKA